MIALNSAMTFGSNGWTKKLPSMYRPLVSHLITRLIALVMTIISMLSSCAFLSASKRGLTVSMCYMPYLHA